MAGVPGSHEWGYLDLNSLEGTLNLSWCPQVRSRPILSDRPAGTPARASVGQDQDTTRGSAGVAGLGSRSPQASPLTFVGTGYYLGTTEGVTGAITGTLTLSMILGS